MFYFSPPTQNTAAFYRCECYDYLFDIAVQMKQCGLDPAALPVEEKGIVWYSLVLFKDAFVSEMSVEFNQLSEL